jgi:hypothetical protein
VTASNGQASDPPAAVCGQAGEWTATAHITGGLAAHDRIVFGDGPRRGTDRTPVPRKPITGEPGGVGATAGNTRTSLGHLTPRAGWGAFPGHETHAGSGVGRTRNALLVDHVERTVPFRPARLPLPPRFPTSRNGRRTARPLTRSAAEPGPLRLAAMAPSAATP